MSLSINHRIELLIMDTQFYFKATDEVFIHTRNVIDNLSAYKKMHSRLSKDVFSKSEWYYEE